MSEPHAPAAPALPDEARLADKRAIVTGATSGIGLAVAARLVKGGARVALIGLDADRGRSIAASLGAADRCRFLQADVADMPAMEAAFDDAAHAFGGLDFLVNNAGVLGGPRFPASRPEYWQRAIGTNQLGVLNGIQLASRFMTDRGGGAIVNVASTSGLTPNPVDPIYAMTKAGVVNLTRSLMFMQEEQGIRLNCVCPGLVATPLEDNSAQILGDEDRLEFKRRRAGRTSNPALTADDVAQCVVRLLLDESLNGCCLKITHGKPVEIILSVAPHKL